MPTNLYKLFISLKQNSHLNQRLRAQEEKLDVGEVWINMLLHASGGLSLIKLGIWMFLGPVHIPTSECL